MTPSFRPLLIGLTITLFASCASGPQLPSSPPVPEPEPQSVEEAVRLFEGTTRLPDRGDERVLLGLYPDGSTRVESVAPGTAPFLQTGSWRELPDGVEVVLTGTRLIDFDEPVVIAFRRTGDSLVAERAAPDFFGPEPLRLDAAGTGPSVLLAGTGWELIALERSGVTYLPRSEGLFTISFSEDGLLAGRADCNTVRALYSDVGGRITTGPVMTTRAACPPGSLFTDFVQLLDAADRYDLIDGELVLEASGGTLRFAPADE